MAKPKVYITRTLPEEGLEPLRKKCEVRMYPKEKTGISRKELLKAVKWADALIPLATDIIDAKVIKAGKNLKVIASYSVGFNHVDLKAASARGIHVTNTPTPLVSDAVSEHTFALMLSITRRIVEADKFTRAGKYKYWRPKLFLGPELRGRTLGLIRLGRIGKGVVKRATGCMGMKVMYHDVIRDKKFEKEFNAKFVSKTELLKNADIISLHVPLLKSTHHLISAKELNMMKKTAYLINTARGPVVDEKALVSALKKGKIAGAGLDVYEFEPKFAPGLTKLDNVILTPHIASATMEARIAMGEIVVNNILATFAGKRPPNKVN